MAGLGRSLLAVAAGLLLVLAFPPFSLWWLAPVAVAVLAAVLDRRSAWAGAGLGALFGVAFFAPLLHWSGTYVGALPWLLLTASQAAFVGLLGAGTALATRLPGRPWWVGVLWVGEEALRDRVPFGGFPWGRLAFSQGGSSYTRLAALGGAPLVTFAVALSGGLLGYAGLAILRRHRGRWFVRRRVLLRAGALAVAGVLVALAGLAVPLPAPDGPSVTVAVVQGNVPRLGLDFAAQREAVLDNHVARTLDLAARVRSGRLPRPDLVIWPENASDVDPSTNPDAAAKIAGAVRAVGVPVLVGTLTDAPGNRIYNVGQVWSPGSGPGERYIKRHPVPFGEYIPLRSLARLVSIKVDLVRRDFAPGRRPGVLMVGPARVGDVICFEVAYDGLVRDVVTGGGRLLVVQTNNATFGRTGETQQQLAMSRLRAVEHGRTVLVAATSGISAIIGPDGRVRQQSRVFTPDLLVASVRLADRRTLAARLGALPEWLLAAAGALGAAGGLVLARRQEA